MARYSAAARTSAGSTTLPIISLYAVANNSGTIREIGVFNTTTTAVALKIARLSTTGTQGSTITAMKHNDRTPTPQCTAKQTHSVAPTIDAGDGYQAVLGAAVGAGVIWTFGDLGLLLPAGTGNGVGVVVATGTGQVCDAYIVWDE